MKCTTYAFLLNHTRFTTEDPHPTGHEILVTAGVADPECYSLYLLAHGGRELVRPDEKVDLTKPGVERFAAILDKPKNGTVQTKRRDFPLADHVEAMLEELELEVDTLIDKRGARWAVTPPMATPPGFVEPSVQVAFPVPSNPEGAFDMFWAKPALSLKNGRAIDRVSMVVCVDGEKWQRWSRHYVSPWNPKHCNLATHLMAVLGWLQAEVQ